jgi:hypothetical protein
MEEPTGRSNAASAVGRRVSVTLDDNEKNSPALDGLVVAFDPKANAHTIQFDNGSTKSLILNCTKFKWIVEATCSEASDLQGVRLARFRLALDRDAVHRKLKVFHKGRGEWFHGTIVGFSEQSGKHQIKFESLKKESECNLSKRNFRWTDLIGARSSMKPHTLFTSRFMGVRRTAENRWVASKSGGKKGCHIGTFNSEKDAALAHDVYARKEGRPVNFATERMSEEELKVLKTTQKESTVNLPVWGLSKFRGVHWQKNRERWMSRYTLAQRGEKNINLGAFVSAKYAALAFDAEARRRGRPDAHLNFPDLHPSDTEIEAWKMNGTHYSMMSSGHKKSSQYRGVTVQKGGSFHVQINIKKVFEGLGKEKGPASIGVFRHEKEAALVFDRVCRRYGVAEKELNFPRDGQLKEVRLFDNECYFCCQERPADPVATPCNHIFCRPCVSMWLTGRKKCPCCQTSVTSEEVLRPVDLVPWPKDKKNQKVAEVAEHQDGSNNEDGSDDGDIGSESTNSSLGKSEDDEEEEAAEDDSEDIDGQDDESRDAALRSGESEVGLVSASSACAKVVNSKRKGCAPEQVDGKPRKAGSDCDRVVKERRPAQDRGKASWIQDGISEMDEVEFIVVPTSSSVKTKTLETKRKASCAPKHAEGKRRKAESRNDTDRVVKERRPTKDHGNALRVNDGGTETDEVERIELPTKTLETKRQASCTRKHAGDKRRKSDAHNDTDRILEQECRAGKDQGNASLVKGDSARAQSSNTTDRASAPSYPVGTRFRKEFPGHGTFQGTIMSFDGEHHKVYYSSDGDSEELSDYELDDVEIIEIPAGRAKASNKKVNR